MLNNIYFAVILIVGLIFLSHFLVLKAIKLAEELLIKHKEADENFHLYGGIKKIVHSSRYYLFLCFAPIFLIIIYFFLIKKEPSSFWVFPLVMGILLGKSIVLDAFLIGLIFELKDLEKNYLSIFGKISTKYFQIFLSAKYRFISLSIISFLFFIYKPSAFLFGVFFSQIALMLEFTGWRAKFLQEIRKKAEAVQNQQQPKAKLNKNENSVS